MTHSSTYIIDDYTQVNGRDNVQIKRQIKDTVTFHNSTDVSTLVTHSADIKEA